MDSLNKHKNANLKYYEMGATVLQVAKQAWKIYVNRNTPEMVDDKRLLLSHIFSNTTINGKNIEVSYHKAFKIIFDRVHEALIEKTNPKKTFEPPKKPVDKEKSRACGSAHPIWLRRQDSNLRPSA